MESTKSINYWEMNHKYGVAHDGVFPLVLMANRPHYTYILKDVYRRTQQQRIYIPDDTRTPINKRYTAGFIYVRRLAFKAGSKYFYDCIKFNAYLNEECTQIVDIKNMNGRLNISSEALSDCVNYPIDDFDDLNVAFVKYELAQ